MSRVPPEVWQRLTAARPSGDQLTARVALPDITDRLLAAIDSESVRHLLVPLAANDPGLEDSQSRGLEVLTREMLVIDRPAARYLDVTCQDPAGQDAFDLIAVELGKLLAAVEQSPAECMTRVLSKWRRFWGQPPQQLLPFESQIGLFAELWFLSNWLTPRVGAAEAVRRWRGPFGARHDFEWPAGSVEAKGTVSTRGIVHHIHGIEQLMPPQTGELLLFSLRVREEGGATNTLPGLVAACRVQFANDDDTAIRFESALVQVGYSPVHEADYANLRLRVVEEGLFAVRDDFPRLTQTQLVAGRLPAGVNYVEYHIDLGGFERFRIARTPSDFSMV